MLAIANSALLIPRIVMPVLTVATGVGVIAAGITVGVIVGTQVSVWTNTQIVLEAPATVVVNRFIESIEVPYFYNVDETMNVFIDSTKQVLKNRFGARFVNILLKNFSSTPNVTSTYTKTLTKSQNIVIPDSSTDGQSAALLMNDHTTTDSSTTTSNNCVISVTTFYCDETPHQRGRSCKTNTSFVSDCIDTISDLVACVNKTVPVHNCSSQNENRIICEKSSIIIPDNCFNQTTTPDTTTTIVTTTAITNNASPCEPSNDATNRSSIITSKLFIYFIIKQGESISVEEIIVALKNLQPPITLWTKCLISSSRPSSYNTTLSKVDPPKKSKEDFISLVNQPSASNELRESVNEQATTALENAGVFNETIITTPPTPPLTTVPNVTQQIG